MCWEVHAEFSDAFYSAVVACLLNVWPVLRRSIRKLYGGVCCLHFGD